MSPIYLDENCHFQCYKIETESRDRRKVLTKWTCLKQYTFKEKTKPSTNTNQIPKQICIYKGKYKPTTKTNTNTRTHILWQQENKTNFKYSRCFKSSKTSLQASKKGQFKTQITRYWSQYLCSIANDKTETRFHNFQAKHNINTTV